jgi:hypothetical protein
MENEEYNECDDCGYKAHWKSVTEPHQHNVKGNFIPVEKHEEILKNQIKSSVDIELYNYKMKVIKMIEKEIEECKYSAMGEAVDILTDLKKEFENDK